MKLLLSEPRGFCAGVERAIEIVQEALDIWPAPIYVKHEIVHNKHVVDELAQRGAVFIENLDEVPEKSILIYSAHGVSPEVRLQAKKRKLFEIDATCPLVTKVHSAAKRFAEKGYKIVLIGHKNHVETLGTYGEAPDQTVIVETPEDVSKLHFEKDAQIFYLMQTTLSLDDVDPVVSALKTKYPQAKTLPSSSICFATTNRQEALKAVCNQTDLILIIGDAQSSNSNRLREIGDRRGIPSYLINNPDEIQANWLENVKVIGMTAGASTPDLIVQKCIEKLKELGVVEIEENKHIEENVIFDIPKVLKQAKTNV